jgi:hypothetical protein
LQEKTDRKKKVVIKTDRPEFDERAFKEGREIQYQYSCGRDERVWIMLEKLRREIEDIRLFYDAVFIVKLM